MDIGALLIEKWDLLQAPSSPRMVLVLSALDPTKAKDIFGFGSLWMMQFRWL